MSKKKKVNKNTFIKYDFANPFEFATELALERSDISDTWPKSIVRELNALKKEDILDSQLGRSDLTNKIIGLNPHLVLQFNNSNDLKNIKFELIGAEDASMDAISLEEIKSWSNYVNYNGSTKDVRPYIKACHVYVLPSHHEGLPRSTLEAMSIGRPILTTNASGCKETVEEGINGFMVPVGSINRLADKMIWFINNKDKIQIMGKQSRKLVEKKFDVRKVNEEMLRIMNI